MADVAEIHTMIKEMKDMMTGLKNGLDRLEARGYGEFSPYRHRLNNNPRTPTVLPIEGCTVTFVVAPVGQAKRIGWSAPCTVCGGGTTSTGPTGCGAAIFRTPSCDVQLKLSCEMRNKKDNSRSTEELIQRSMGFGG